MFAFCAFSQNQHVGYCLLAEKGRDAVSWCLDVAAATMATLPKRVSRDVNEKDSCAVCSVGYASSLQDRDLGGLDVILLMGECTGPMLSVKGLKYCEKTKVIFIINIAIFMYVITGDYFDLQQYTIKQPVSVNSDTSCKFHTMCCRNRCTLPYSSLFVNKYTKELIFRLISAIVQFYLFTFLLFLFHTI